MDNYLVLVKKRELEKNINHDYDIDNQTQFELRSGCNNYILEFGQKLDLPQSLVSLAIIYNNYFFIKKSYVNHDRYVIGAASLFLAAKKYAYHKRLIEFCHIYHRMVIAQDSSMGIFDDETHTHIKSLILNAELSLLRVMDFRLDVRLPNAYVGQLVNIFAKKDQSVMNTALTLAYDSVRTEAILLYSGKLIALACVIAAMDVQGCKPDDPTWFLTLDENVKAIHLNDITVLILRYYEKLKSLHGADSSTATRSEAPTSSSST